MDATPHARALAWLIDFLDRYWGLVGAAAVVTRAYPAEDADGFLVIASSGGRFTEDADGFLVADAAATTGARVTYPAGGGFGIIY